MIDRLREQIEDRLKELGREAERVRKQIDEHLRELGGEAERLREALAALDPRPAPSRAPKPQARKPRSKTRATKTARPVEHPSTKVAAAAVTPEALATGAPTAPPPDETSLAEGAGQRRASRAAASPRRAAGATRAQVLDALADGESLTAGQVAESTGLARGTVATTLSRLVRSGELQKAERGYRLASVGTAATAPAGSTD